MRPLARTLAPGAVVLGYHRVAEASWDPLKLAVRPRHFSAQLELLTRSRRVISLRALARLQATGEPLEAYAAVTFDDGYSDFATTVLPIVESFEVPVTVFVATGFIGGTFWWDEVSALVKAGAGDTLEVAGEGGTSWRYGGLGGREARAATARDLCERLACAGEGRIRGVVRQLRARTTCAAPVLDGSAMSRTQLEAVAHHPLVEVGAHTVSHGCLADLALSEQRAEISRSKASIEALPGASAAVFSYPNGSFSVATPALVRSLGFSCACTSREGVFRRRTDPYRIPRIWAPDAAAPDFRRWLGSWVAGVT